jgi:glyoxylase-like metal-dependent hydrolase (beta-lactamase superfamily II)
MTDFVTGAPVEGSLDVRWIHGVKDDSRDPGPLIQVHAFDEHTYLLRQSKSVHYEAPFMYLLMGSDRAVLLDTGATADAATFPLRDTVEGVLKVWLARNQREVYELIVAHTHAHGDHIAGDGQFVGRADTTVVGVDLPSVQSFFGFSHWPEEVVEFDLGGRVLEVTGIPGHHQTAIAIFDRWTGFLLTGDTVYPGRLYGRDMAAFVDSMDRLVEFARQRPVRHVMGCHIEMTTTPGRDYPIGTTYQPDEPPLQMSMQQLFAVRDAAHAVNHKPGTHVFDNFVIVNGA